MTRFLALSDGISRILAGAAMVMLAALVADMVYEVVSRRLFSRPTLWAYDVAYMLNGVCFLFAAGHTLRRNGHIRIDFLSTRLPRRAQDWINVFAYVVLIFPAMAFLVLGAWTEWLEALLTGEVDPASPWKPALWPLFGGIFAGFASLFLQMAAECVRHVRAALGFEPSPLAHRDVETPDGENA